MRRLALLLALGAVATVVGSAARGPAAATRLALPAQSPPRFGILDSALVRIDPRTLAALPDGRLAVGTHTFGWSFSRDGSRLALGGDVDYGASLLVVDTASLRALGRVRLTPSGWLRATTWLRDGRVVAVVSDFSGGGVRTDLVTVDGSGRKVLRRQVLSGQILRVARTSGGLVVLRTPAEALGPPRLTVIGATGRTTEIVVRGISSGSQRADGKRGAEFAQRDPGLAVDGAGHAFVVDATQAAEVDLATRAVSYHRLTQPRSFFARVHEWLEPAAAAKSFEGPSRVARWLGNGMLAVSGGDYSVTGKKLRFQPLGLELVDTRRWSVRRLGRGTDDVWPAGAFLLAAATTSSSELEQPTPPGLVAYDAAGDESWRLFAGSHAWAIYADAQRAYVWVDKGVSVVDLATGQVVERRKAIAWPLVAPGPPTES